MSERIKYLINTLKREKNCCQLLKLIIKTTIIYRVTLGASSTNPPIDIYLVSSEWIGSIFQKLLYL